MVYYRGPDGKIHILGDSTELQHHGVLGQKWGVRRYQSYPKGHVGGKEIGKAKESSNKKKSNSSNERRSARKIQRSLNKNDYKLSEASFDKNELEERKSKIQYRAKKTKSDSSKARKLKAIGKIDAKIAVKNSKIAEHEKIAKKLLKEADKNGYTVNSKYTMRTVHKGEVAAQMMIAAPVLALTPAPMAVITYKQTSGTKYKVKQRR